MADGSWWVWGRISRMSSIPGVQLILTILYLHFKTIPILAAPTWGCARWHQYNLLKSFQICSQSWRLSKRSIGSSLSAARYQDGIHGCGRASPWSASTSDTCRRRKQHLLLMIFSEHITCTYKISNCFTLNNVTSGPSIETIPQQIITHRKHIYKALNVHTLVRTYTCWHPWISLHEQTKESLQTCVEMGGPIHASPYPCQSVIHFGTQATAGAVSIFMSWKEHKVNKDLPTSSNTHTARTIC